MSKKKNNKISKEAALTKLWEMGELSWKLKGKQKEIYKILKEDEKDVTCVLVSRRFGKCIAEGTLIPTTKGMKKIEDIQVGDYVYGYNKDGDIEPTKVLQLHDQGIKEVYDLIHSRKVYATVTEDHKFLTYNHTTQKETVKSVKEMYGHEKIRREFIEAECGEIQEDQAYAIGALLGDGCSRQGINAIHISSDDEEIVCKVKEQLNAKYHYKQSKHNYTWVITNNEKGHKHWKYREPRPVCGLYEEWCSGKYAHEKKVDLDIVKKWNRESCLQFLAGIIDTDGSICVNNNILQVRINSQSKSIVDACKFLFNQLFFVDCNIHVDNRDKYINGPLYILYVNNNLHSKRIVKELTNYLQVSRKKWKKEYSYLLENNTSEKYLGIKKVNKRKKQCWDIGINNGTHLFLMQNGLITHNSFINCLLAVETCIKIPGAIVKYACPKQRMVKTIIRPIMREIFKDAPEQFTLNDMWKENDKVYVFPNGSEIQLSGTDLGNAENLRGGYANLLICDEAGFMTDLDYVVNSIMLPTTDTTDGRLLLTSTPNYKDPNHEFHESFVHPIEAEGRLIKYTIDESPMVTPEKIKKIEERYPGGRDNPKFKCEYLCQIPQSSELSVIPEFHNVKDRIIINEDIEYPPFRDFYIGMDVGFKDLTVALFGFYDFREATLYILDELVMNGPEMTTDNLAKEIKHKEELYFHDPESNEYQKPFLRIMDNDLKLINDLSKLHNLFFIATEKHNREAAINNVRIWIHNERIKIHSRCKHLIYHLGNAQWNKTRKDFKELKDSPNGEVRGGHADGVPALIYLVRNIVESKNPYPEEFGRLSGPNVFKSPRNSGDDSKSANFMRSILNLGKNNT